MDDDLGACLSCRFFWSLSLFFTRRPSFSGDNVCRRPTPILFADSFIHPPTSVHAHPARPTAETLTNLPPPYTMRTIPSFCL